MTPNNAVISLRGISKKYRLYDTQAGRLKDALPFYPGKHHKDFWALKDISLDVAKGETLGIIGVNGSGKSTLLQTICGLLKPTTGEMMVRGRISALLELGSGFNPLLSGRENVYLQGSILGFSRKEIDARYQRILDFADIGAFIDQPVKSYSSGMMIRLAFSVAVQVEPEVLIVDEALSVGDVFFQSKCFRKFEELRSGGVTVLLVSHQLASIQTLCDRAIFLDKGRVMYEGLPKDTVQAYQKYAGTLHAARNVAPPPIASANENAPIDVQSWDQPTTKQASATEKAEETRYGNGKAWLRWYRVNGVENCSEVSVSSAKKLTVEVSYEVREHISKPFVGVRIDTLNGLQIYANNTTFAGHDLASCSPSDEIQLRFEQTLYLNRGSYMLTIVFAEWTENGEVQFVDRYVDAVHLLLTDGPYPYAGICNFVGSIDSVT